MTGTALGAAALASCHEKPTRYVVKLARAKATPAPELVGTISLGCESIVVLFTLHSEARVSRVSQDYPSVHVHSNYSATS